MKDNIDNSIDTTTEETAAEKPGLWQHLTGWRGRKNMPTAIKAGLIVLGFAALMGLSALLYAIIPADGMARTAIDFPNEWNFGWDVIKFIDNIVEWVVINWDPFFSLVNKVLLHGVLLPLERYFLWLPWWSIPVITGLLAWRTVSLKFGLTSVVFLLLISLAGLLDLASQTLAITLTSAMICVIIGLPLGIIAARSDRFNNTLRPILDGMQTMPSFVYLIPALMLFGIGRVPAVIATCIYAVPPIIRLTSLGIRQVDSSVVEASKSFGTTAWQLLHKVQVPMAMPTILAGLNQTIMMALAMVVIASMIGAAGMGTEILLGISRLQVGRGVLAGMGIVFMAIILDRISQGFANRPNSSTSG
jgi:glycine betaine/proline transport system permease protein